MVITGMQRWPALAPDADACPQHADCCCHVQSAPEHFVLPPEAQGTWARIYILRGPPQIPSTLRAATSSTFSTPRTGLTPYFDLLIAPPSSLQRRCPWPTILH